MDVTTSLKPDGRERAWQARESGHWPTRGGIDVHADQSTVDGCQATVLAQYRNLRRKEAEATKSSMQRDKGLKGSRQCL
jgi:hypothetical protein